MSMHFFMLIRKQQHSNFTINGIQKLKVLYVSHWLAYIHTTKKI